MSDNHNATLHRFRYRIELLEDLHSGSGLGSAWVDRTIARDRNGNPVIPASHIKGVWRDNAMRLAEFGAKGLDRDQIDAWFGAAPKNKKDKTEPKQGRLYCPRLELVEQDVETIVWMQTARQPGSRKPADDTLRSTEYLPAGIQLQGHGFFIGSAEEFGLLENLIRRVDRYGGNRSRGDGRVRIIEIKEEELAGINCPKSGEAEYGVRLLLEAEAPLQIPRTGFPGNIIESDTRIPGRMLAGSIIRQLIGKKIDAELFGRQVSVGDALPVSGEIGDIDSTSFDRLEVIPAPLEYRVEKPPVAESASFQYLPGWATEAASNKSVNAWKDLLSKRHDDTQIKRLPAGTYVYRAGDNAWRASRQPLELAMRNRRGSDTAAGAMGDELFSSEQIPAGTRFLAEIRAGDDHEAWSKWLDTFSEHFSETPVLFVGRGGAPVRLVMVRSLPEAGREDPAPPETLRLTLTSDAVIRTPWLAFHQRLTLQALCDALDIDVPEDTTADDVSESRLDRAFNGATRLPRPSVMTLRAGSTILIRGKEGVETLRASLQGRRAIGERQHEGMGRFRLDLDLDLDLGTGTPAKTQAHEGSAPELRTELVARFAREQMGKHAAAIKKPSQSQWGNVRAALDAIPQGQGAKSIDLIRRNLAETAKRTRAGEVFSDVAKKDGFLDELVRRAESGWSIEDVRQALKLVLAHLSAQHKSTENEHIAAAEPQDLPEGAE